MILVAPPIQANEITVTFSWSAIVVLSAILILVSWWVIRRLKGNLN